MFYRLTDSNQRISYNAIAIYNFLFLCLQCAQRWEELRLSNSAVAGDISGLTATGRPVSSHSRKQISQLVRSMLNQPINRYDLSPSGYTSDLRPHPMLSERSKSFTDSSLGRPTISSVNEDNASGHFVANFCQTVLSSSVLSGSTSSSVLKNGGLKTSARVEEREEAGGGESTGNE